MFYHIFKTRLKVALRDRETLIWTLAFPILLGTLFVLTFGGWIANETFQAIPIAVVDDANYRADPMLQETLQAVSILESSDASRQEDALFELAVVTEAKADVLLQEGEIAGYFIAENPLRLVVRGTGIRQTIIKVFLDEYQQTAAAAEAILQENPQQASALVEDLQNRTSYLSERPISAGNPDFTLIYHFALIAMTCLYGGYVGLREVTALQANLSDLAARVSTTPMRKGPAIVASLAAGWVIHYASILLLWAYLHFLHGVHFGDRIGLIFLAILTGSLTGMAIGAFIGTVSRFKESVKSALVTGISLILSFLAGLMVADIKYITTQAWPILRYINPAVLISDSFYTLYFYDTTARYWQSIGLQVLMMVILFAASALLLKRRRYASL